jgi:hypothetical protein
MDSLDFLYALRDVDGFNGRLAPKTIDAVSPARAETRWLELAMVVAGGVLLVTLFLLYQRVQGR